MFIWEQAVFHKGASFQFVNTGMKISKIKSQLENSVEYA